MSNVKYPFKELKPKSYRAYENHFVPRCTIAWPIAMSSKEHVAKTATSPSTRNSSN